MTHQLTKRSLIHRHQRGSALVMGLVVLTMITVTAMVAMQRSTLQLRMVGSMQRDQQVFNATFNYLANGYFNMTDSPTDAIDMLSDLIGNNGAVDPYEKFGISKPLKADIVGDVSGTVSGVTVTYSSSNLKANEGNGQGGETTYQFTYRATAAEKGAGQIRSTQEIALSLVAPAIE